MNSTLWRVCEGQAIDGKYHLQRLLGTGSYGGVFLADEVVADRLIRQVAVKLIEMLQGLNVTAEMLPSGGAVRTRPNGRVSDVHDTKRGMDVHHGLNGNRRVSMERHDGSRMVSERGRPGYVQRGYSYHGHDFARRSYYYHGHEYNRYYRGYGFRGLSLNIYSPGVYYGPGFYGWAYNPWAAPIAFGWGWGGSPWYGYYGGYFQPYPVYPSASYWLTDYIISQNLQAAYAAHQEAGEVDGAQSSAGGPPALTTDVKQQIADEVKGQLALENAEATQTAQHQDVDPASSGIARILADVSAGHAHVFVAGSALDVTNPNGQECALSDGDVLVVAQKAIWDDPLSRKVDFGNSTTNESTFVWPVVSATGGVLKPAGHEFVPPGKHDCVVLPLLRSGMICKKRARLKNAGSRRAPAKTVIPPPVFTENARLMIPTPLAPPPFTSEFVVPVEFGGDGP